MTEETKKTASSNGFKAEITSSAGLRHTLRIEAPSENVRIAFEEEFRKIQKRVTLKGFRKGKAPLSHIRSQFGTEVQGEVIEKLVNSCYQSAIQTLELHPATMPNVTDVTLKEGEPFVCMAEVEVFPEIKSVDLAGLTAVETSPEVSDEEIEDVIDSLRKRHAEMKDVERSAKQSDILTTDMRKTEDENNIIDGDFFPDSVIDLGDEKTVKEFKDALVGAAVGEERTVTVKYPSDYPDKVFAEKSLTYAISIKKIQERILPELNDEFAKDVAQAESLAVLKERVRSGISGEKQTSAVRDLNNQLISQVVAKNPLEVPDGLVSRYVDDIVAEYRKNYTDQLDKPGNEAEVRQRYRAIGTNQLRWKLLSEKIFEQENIEVLPEDTDKWIEDFGSRNGMPVEQARDFLAKSGKAGELRDSIREEKLLSFLKSKATIKQKA
jgi:trigger factor